MLQHVHTAMEDRQASTAMGRLPIGATIIRTGTQLRLKSRRSSRVGRRRGWNVSWTGPLIGRRQLPENWVVTLIRQSGTAIGCGLLDMFGTRPEGKHAGRTRQRDGQRAQWADAVSRASGPGQALDNCTRTGGAGTGLGVDATRVGGSSGCGKDGIQQRWLWKRADEPRGQHRQHRDQAGEAAERGSRSDAWRRRPRW